tara:strand:- start:38 stop:331 length:294 start_codon:yes stop_codon:yes gene_type:complete
MEPLYNKQGRLVGYFGKVKKDENDIKNKNFHLSFLLEKPQLENRLKEINISKKTLSDKLGVTQMTLHNKFNKPKSITLGELIKLKEINFLTRLEIEI